MTNERIAAIEAARACGSDYDEIYGGALYTRFLRVIREAEARGRDQSIADAVLARDVQWATELALAGAVAPLVPESIGECIEQYAAEVRAQERHECFKLADGRVDGLLALSRRRLFSGRYRKMAVGAMTVAMLIEARNDQADVSADREAAADTQPQGDCGRPA